MPLSKGGPNGRSLLQNQHVISIHKAAFEATGQSNTSGTGTDDNHRVVVVLVLVLVLVVLHGLTVSWFLGIVLVVKGAARVGRMFTRDHGSDEALNGEERIAGMRPAHATLQLLL